MSYRLWLARRRTVSEPKEFADWLHMRCRNVDSARSDCAKNRRLLTATHEKCNAQAAFDYRVGHGDAHFGTTVRHSSDPSFAFLQYRFAGEERGRVTIRSSRAQSIAE